MPHRLPILDLGSYELIEPLGSGGMGDVYRARDRRLAREVAVKLLRPEQGAETERLARFEREARVLAALQHSNIAVIYDVGEARLPESAGDLATGASTGSPDGSRTVPYIVMELVAGETLDRRIPRGGLDLERFYELAIPLADALAAAHDAGIIHRDLKPSNVMVTPDGRVKVLDFGLAKHGLQGGDDEATETLAEPLTGEGRIVGTVAYMSPEQAEGRPVDHRSDIFSLGVVLYQMIAGERPFGGDSPLSTLSSILRDSPPPVARVRAGLPRHLGRIIGHCLQKDPQRRYQSARDVLNELTALERETVDEESTELPARPARRTRVPVLGALAIVALLATAVATWLVARSGQTAREPTSPAMRVELLLDPPMVNYPFLRSFAVSPGGRKIVYVAGDQNRGYRLHLRTLDSDQRASRPLSTPEGPVSAPFFSPDGKWVGFQMTDTRRLMKLDLDTGAVRLLCSLRGIILGASWGSDGAIVFLDNLGALWRVAESGGIPRQVGARPADEAPEELIGTAHLLPDAQAALLTVQDADSGRPQILLMALPSGDRRLLGPGSDARYVPTPSGHLVYVEGDSLAAVPFDREELEITGAAVPLPFRPRGPNGSRWFAVSSSGWLFSVPAEGAWEGQLVWVDREGHEEPLGGVPSGFASGPPGLRLSPDGARAAFSGGWPPDIHVLELESGRETALTSDAHFDFYPVWTRDGKSVVFMSSREGPFQLFRQAADGSSEPERLIDSEHDRAPTSFSPDGRWLLFYEVHPDTLRDLWILDMDEGEARPFLVTPANERAGVFSPDGRWIAFVSDRDGPDQVYLKRYPDDGTLHQVSTDGGAGPFWGRDGHELLYRRGAAIMSVRVDTEPSLFVHPPRELFRGAYRGDAFGNASAALGPEGDRLLMISSEDPGGTSRIEVVTDWFQELERLAPPSR